MNKKGFFLFLLLVFSLFNGYSSSYVQKEKNFTYTAFFREESFPGDAVFVRLAVKKNSFFKKYSETTRARLELFAKNENKPLKSSDFYILPEAKNKKNSRTFLTGIPLSSFIDAGYYLLKITVNIQDNCTSIQLPLLIQPKEFISETIPLNSANTAIRTDNSQKRMKQIEDLNKILFSTNTDNVYSTESFIYPTDGKRRTSFFADRRVFAYSNGKSSTSLHYGIDWGLKEGTSVYACADGKIVMAEDRITTGWSIVIEHLPGLYSLYYHMSKLNVSAGDFAQKEDLIGLTGCTGLATGPHLHWEIRLNGEAVNPDFMTEDFTFEKEAEIPVH